MIKPELLMPAGSLQKLKYAYAYGADAVYAGVPLFSLRARENEFKFEDLKTGIELAHSMGRKLYLTANVFARNVKIKPFEKHIDQWVGLKPDALIMSDPGLIITVRERHPDVPIHLSVQANCMNWKSVKFWQSVGVERIILSRELRLEEIQEIKQRVPEMELEAFVHGSICIAYSGRCLLSHYMSNRDANQGVCDNSCRYEFNVHKTKAQPTNEDYYIEDLRNKGEFYQIDEDENGTYIMNAKDLRLIEHLKKIWEAGICSFKAEGRTKSVYYTAMTTRAYRKAIDDMVEGRDFNRDLLGELDKVANRGYHEGFMIRKPSADAQNYDTSVARNYTQKFSGLVLNPAEDSTGRMRVEVRNKMTRGQRVELIAPNSTRVFTIGDIYDEKGNPVNEVHGGAGVYDFAVDFPAPKHGLLSAHLEA